MAMVDADRRMRFQGSGADEEGSAPHVMLLAQREGGPPRAARLGHDRGDDVDESGERGGGDPSASSGRAVDTESATAGSNDGDAPSGEARRDVPVLEDTRGGPLPVPDVPLVEGEVDALVRLQQRRRPRPQVRPMSLDRAGRRFRPAW
ncbi:hypothetical protein [Streptomyces cyaneus]|uniref:hypothetical protein n=1 Tax=Streptomyces cyaneus TaxID=1904 RepID=UPI000FF88894|nr:hypothetical protein [Streptomyces cyaneus]